MSASFVVEHSIQMAEPGRFTVGVSDSTSIAIPQNIAEAVGRFGLSDPEDLRLSRSVSRTKSLAH